MVSHAVISYCVIMVNADFCDQCFVILSGSPVSHVSMFFPFCLCQVCMALSKSSMKLYDLSIYLPTYLGS